MLPNCNGPNQKLQSQEIQIQIQIQAITNIIQNETMYYLDSHKEIKVFNIKLNDNYSTLLLAKPVQKYTVEQCLGLVENIIAVLESSTSLGFLPTLDLRKFPIISDLLQPFLLSVKENEVEEYVCGDKSMETYKWLYNLIILILYQICIETLSSIDLSVANTEKIEELKLTENEMYSRLDPSIRQYLQKRGISIKQNTYIGFDTEFQIAGDLNRLISSQLAVTTKTVLKIPRVRGYTISKLDESTNKLQAINKSSTVLNYSKIENSIKMFIADIRVLKYASYDVNLYQLSEGMKMLRGIQYIEQEDNTIFSLPRSILQPYIHYGSSFSFKQIIDISSAIAKPHHDHINSVLMDVIEKISMVNSSNTSYTNTKENLVDYDGIEKLAVGIDKTLPLLETTSLNLDGQASDLPLITSTDSKDSIDSKLELDPTEKRLSRDYISSLFPQKISVTKTRQYYLIAHLTPADLSLLSDFDKIKEELSILNGSFVTLGKPLKYCGKNIHIRDTMLLAPGPSKSLAAIGRLYGGAINKIVIDKTDLEDMHGFLARDKVKFTEYALRDAVISLIHACWMEEFNFRIGCLGVPLSLSSIGRNYVKSIWAEELYKGYQISTKYLLGDVSASITPKGLNVIKQVGYVLPYYIANYKGGRNECFMFGVERDTTWYDYDLTNAYTTILSVAGHPDYENCIRLSISDLNKMSKIDKLYSYLIIHADFEFPLKTKYPSIPCYVDENCTIYPLKGNCIITGAEYILALSQHCSFKILDVYNTPYKTLEHKDIKPFGTIINLVQEQRREHPKGTLSNQMYKEIGNSIYGSVVRGIGNKRKFDIKSQGTLRMYGDELTNPLIASWTTALVRSVIGECLHAIHRLGGKVVSVTTDGFITNLDNLEQQISDNFLFQEFKKIRHLLSGDYSGLELKSQGKGIIAWSTRGQLGLESRIIATTGIQHKAFQDKDDMLKWFIETMKSSNRTLEFVQGRLRSATDIYKRGGHVTMLKRDQLFRMHYDNRRQLEWETTIPQSIEVLVDSKPLETILQGRNLRFIARLCKQPQYGKYIGGSKKLREYRGKEELVVRNFLKCLLSTPPLYNLTRNELNTYPLIIDYLKMYNPSLKVSENSLALISYKVRHNKLKWRPLQPTAESEKFINFLLVKFKDLDVEGFYGQKRRT